MKRISLRVTGKVQGVFYRAGTEKIARKIGVTGFVQNEQDGNVYIEAQGTEEQLEEFTKWCRRGPERAVVENVTRQELAVRTEDGFRIRR
jgi:acylphosphatase